MAEILVRCSAEQRERIKAKAKAANLSISGYLLNQGLKDDRLRDVEDATALVGLYHQLLLLQQTMQTLPAQAALDRAIELCQEVRREIVLFRLERRLARYED